MIVTFAWPTSARFGGGVVTLFEYADALARRGHEVNLVHGPKTPDRIDDPGEITWHRFDDRVRHHVVDTLDDPSLPPGDICFPQGAPPHLGLPVVLIQGYKLIAAAMERPAFRAACPKVCVASWLRDVGVAWGSPAEQLLHVPPGIDHGRFRPPPAPGPRPVDVAMLHSDHPLKGAADGIAALEEVRRRRPGLRVALFGMVAPERTPPPWAEFHLAPSRAELVERVYHRAKVFVQPSRREGLGLTPIEAMACGCALVSTDNGGSRDYAHHDRTALVVPPRDPSALADAVDRLLADDERRQRLADAGRVHARAFDWDRSGELLERHLEDYRADPSRYRRPPGDAPMFLDDSW